MASPRRLVPPPSFPKARSRPKRLLSPRALPVAALVLGGAGLLALAFPSVLAISVRHEPVPATAAEQFPVTVDPAAKLIVENAAVDELFKSNTFALAAAAGLAEGGFAHFANLLTSIPWYGQLASAVAGGKFVTIYPGMRKEEVALTFGKALGWSRADRDTFLDPRSPSALAEGMYAPDTYIVTTGMTPGEVRSLIRERFQQTIGSRYAPEVAEKVPLMDALTIASLLEREAAGNADIRLISGIIWNRLFIGMNLQIDATLQYAKGNRVDQPWWPKVVPNDKYIKSDYNTYKNEGLPPGPIASPSVAAVFAALNPTKTDCMFYFHDSYGRFHCSETYEGHVALLKKHYGRGK